MSDFSDFTIEELQKQLAAWGFKPSNAARLLRHFYERNGEADWRSCRIPQPLMERLEHDFAPAHPPVASRQVASDATVKLLLQLSDARTVECVLMPGLRGDRAAGCVSTQVGCAMGCDFCATARGGLERNLTTGEILAQFFALRREAAASGRRLQTLVFMGMGEPMHNLDNVLGAVRRIAPNELGGLGWRQITVSTVGIVPGIDRLTESGLNINLAVSLHAPDDETRARLLPTARRYGVADILAAATRHQDSRGRPVIIQYCLLQGVNDSPAQARQLAALLAHRRMHVNLLRYNPTGAGASGIQYLPTPDAQAEAFADLLREAGVVAHFRRPRGRDIDAACGQLRERAGQTQETALYPPKNGENEQSSPYLPGPVPHGVRKRRC